MTKAKTDREMLQACLRAIENAQSSPFGTDWTTFVRQLREHLSGEPGEQPKDARFAKCSMGFVHPLPLRTSEKS